MIPNPVMTDADLLAFCEATAPYYTAALNRVVADIESDNLIPGTGGTTKYQASNILGVASALWRLRSILRDHEVPLSTDENYPAAVVQRYASRPPDEGGAPVPAGVPDDPDFM